MLLWSLLIFLAIVIWYIVQNKAKPAIHSPVYTESNTSQSFSSHNIKTVSFEIKFGDSIEIAELDFYGSFSRSPNGRYILAWGGFDGKKYLLIEDSKVITQGKLQQPNDGKIANNGDFIFNDWMSTEGLDGTFYAFSPSGDVITKKTFNANLDNNGISDDGRFAVCKTHGSPHEHDSEIICVFDLEAKRMLSKFNPVCLLVDQYQFDTVNQILHLIYKEKNINHRYSFTGTFLDKETWEIEKESFVSGYELMDKADAKLMKLSGAELSTYSEIIDIYDRALQRGVSVNTQARIHRTLGETYIRCNDPDNGLRHLETALQLYPKIGVKKLVERLRNENRKST